MLRVNVKVCVMEVEEIVPTGSVRGTWLEAGQGAQ
jgi:hypothetical protein